MINDSDERQSSHQDDNGRWAQRWFLRFQSFNNYLAGGMVECWASGSSSSSSLIVSVATVVIRYEVPRSNRLLLLLLLLLWEYILAKVRTTVHTYLLLVY